ncbi:MAG TPA: hypothetical protein VGC41_03910, partial [Kofleriaceae bacterium]
QINTLGKDMSNLMAVTGALVATKAVDAKDLVVDRGGNALSFVADRGGSALTVIAKAVKARPLTSVAIAFGAGLLAMGIVRLASPAAATEEN